MRSERVLGVAFLAASACASPTIRRFPLREPLTIDDDARPYRAPCGSSTAACTPPVYVPAALWNATDGMLFRPITRFLAVDPAGESMNVNALDEVPDSSWFVNRIGRTAIDDPSACSLVTRIYHAAGYWTVCDAAIAGKALGPFTYEGVRKDDPNDVIPHEDRRELRGQRVLAAWLGQEGEQKTLTSWIWSRPGAPDGSIRHWILDPREESHVHALDPDRWTPRYPNPAFARASERDNAWMARIIARFTPEHVERIAEPTIARMLLERRRTILHRYFSILSPITDLSVEGAALCGVDLARKTGTFDTFRYDAAIEGRRRLPVTGREEGVVCVDLPRIAQDGGAADDDPSRYVIVAIDNGVARRALRAHLYDLGPKRGHRLVGIER
jgi:hypothetical protein